MLVAESPSTGHKLHSRVVCIADTGLGCDIAVVGFELCVLDDEHEVVQVGVDICWGSHDER